MINKIQLCLTCIYNISSNHYAAHTAVVGLCVCLLCMSMCVCVCLFVYLLDLSVEPSDRTLRYRNVKFEDHLNVIIDSSLMNYKNMADMRICETLATEVSPTLGINNDGYGP